MTMALGNYLVGTRRILRESMKILVRGTNWIGDAVMTIPALRELRRIFPRDHITLHTRSWAEGIFRDVDFIDEFLIFDEKGSNFRTLFEQAHRIRAGNYDVGIIFPNSYRSAAMMKLGRIPRCFGFAKEGRSMLLTDAIKVPRWKKQSHEVYYYLELIRQVEKSILDADTVNYRDEITGLDISAARKAEAAEMLRGAGLGNDAGIVAIGPGSANSRAKRWGSKNFAELAERVFRDCGAGAAILGSAEDADVAARVREHSAVPLIDLTGKTSLSEAAAILAAVDLFISNDMGLAHIAAAAGTPTIVIFGPTNPETTRPIGSNVQIAREPVDCSPCMLRDCPIDHRCMTRISVDDIMKMAAPVLTGTR